LCYKSFLSVRLKIGKQTLRGTQEVNLPDLGILALVEGVADILPIDASAHAQLAARILGWRAGPVAASLHLGVALALACYLWREVALICVGLWKLRKARVEAGSRLMAKILLAALPLILLQAGVGGVVPPKVNDLLTIGLITLACGFAMLFADRLSLTVKRIEHIGIGTTLAIGLVQLLSVIPGVGRVAAGVTMARLFGMERQDAFRFALLASLPVLLVRAVAEFLQNGQQGQHAGLSDLLAIVVTFVLALLALPFGFGVIRRAGLMPFVLYRLLFGVVLVGLGML
jgi:undecaprenyl-diphosphatase